MLTDLNWDRLATRFYQIQYGLMKICLPDVVILAFNRTRHNHEMKYRTIGCTGLIYKNSFFVRMIPVWNFLPEGAVSAATVAAFQRLAYPVFRSI